VGNVQEQTSVLPETLDGKRLVHLRMSRYLERPLRPTGKDAFVTLRSVQRAAPEIPHPHNDGGVGKAG
jgi:hypothetical protein